MKVDFFFLLLRIGLEIEEPLNYLVSQFEDLSQQDWSELRQKADKQGVSAIVFDGLQKMVNTYGKEKIAPKINTTWWQLFVLEWIGVLTQTEQLNKHQKEVMDDMTKKWAANGCKVMVFKGQNSAQMYPHPEHRSPGDIDCYLFENYAKGNEIARKAGAEVDESWYKHSQIYYKGETFENHQFFVHTRDGKRGKRLQKELEESISSIGGDSIYFQQAPQWNAMFLTYHAYAHFISEGLRFKQLLDWAMLINTKQDEIDWLQFYAFCERNHLKRFADAVTSICKQYLAIEIRNSHIETNSPYTESLLHSILYDDDYVFGSGKGSWHNRWHLVKNLFRYSWKYRVIAQMSPIRQLWYYATGFIFKTE